MVTSPVALERLLVALLVGVLIGLDRERAEARKAPLLLAVVGVALVSYVRTSASGDLGATTEIAAVVTFLLGVVADAGQLVVAGAAGVGVAVLLAAKPSLEGFSRALTGEELVAALELAVISVIILPLLPNRGYGPW